MSHPQTAVRHAKGLSFHCGASGLLRLAGGAALSFALTACGGGGGGGSSQPTAQTSAPSSESSAAIPAGTTQAAPTYAAGSTQALLFAEINADRTQCGWPAQEQNTLLDKAATNHANYMLLNQDQGITDGETPGNPGYTGATADESAQAVGWPSPTAGYPAGTVNFYLEASRMDTGTFNMTTPIAEAGDVLNGFLSGVYHQSGIVGLYSLIGIGRAVGQYTSNGVTAQLTFNSINVASQYSTTPIQPSAAPLTFPCEGVTGMPYQGSNEEPTPPNVGMSDAQQTAINNGVAFPTWGTPVTVMANIGDTVVLQSGTMTDPNGTVIQLEVLDSATDTTTLIAPYEAVAYPKNPLSANTQYSVTLNGTINGTPFSRNFTFSTGAQVG